MSKDMMYAKKLSEMIKVETISIKDVVDIPLFESFHAVLKKEFPLVFSTLEIKNFEGSLLLKWPSKTKKGEPIMLMSHQDVVEATGVWKHGPFSGDIADGAVWGRGTVDTKGALFCILQAFEELLEEKFEPTVDLYICTTCNEETAGNGANMIVDYLKENNVHIGLLLDEGGMIKEEPLKGAIGRFAMIGVLEKGTGNFKFIAKSNGGHASAPGRKTPLVRLGQFMAEIEKKDPFSAKLNPTTIELFKRLGPHIKGPLGFILKRSKFFAPVLNKALPKINPLGAAMIKTTLAFTMAKGSDGLNVLPQEAYVTGNIRFIHHEGVQKTFDILSKIASKYDIEIEIINSADAFPVVDYKGDAFKYVEKTIKEVFTGVIPTPYAMTGGTDARHFAPVCDNAIRFAPLEINEQQFKSIHGLDENINIDTLEKGVEFYKKILKKD